jgi:hypothetical protein
VQIEMAPIMDATSNGSPPGSCRTHRVIEVLSNVRGLWEDWPDRWGTDAGIDIVALDRAGDLWAVQAKADAPGHYTTKREIDSFLSESNRSEFAGPPRSAKRLSRCHDGSPVLIRLPRSGR